MKARPAGPGAAASRARLPASGVSPRAQPRWPATLRLAPLLAALGIATAGSSEARLPNETSSDTIRAATGKSSGACAGYVIDHIVPLKRGGDDAPGNMQWQTRDAAKANDRWE